MKNTIMIVTILGISVVPFDSITITPKDVLVELPIKSADHLLSVCEGEAEELGIVKDIHGNPVKQVLINSTIVEKLIYMD